MCNLKLLTSAFWEEPCIICKVLVHETFLLVDFETNKLTLSPFLVEHAHEGLGQENKKKRSNRISPTDSPLNLKGHCEHPVHMNLGANIGNQTLQQGNDVRVESHSLQHLPKKLMINFVVCLFEIYFEEN